MPPDNGLVSPISQGLPDPFNEPDPPIRLIYSTADELVPYAQATAFQAANPWLDITLETRTGIPHGPMESQADTATLAAWMHAH